MKTKNLCFYILLLASVDNLCAQSPPWIWAQGAGNSGQDQAISTATDAAGNIYLTGYYYSPTIAFGSTTLFNSNPPGKAEIFLVKYGVAGAVLWARSPGGTDNDFGMSVTADNFGNVFVAGYFESTTITFGSVTLTNYGNEDMFLVKYDAGGNVIWAKNAGGNFRELVFSVSADGAGNAYVAGYFESASLAFGSSTITNLTPGTADMFVAKYDSAGNPLWAKSAGGSAIDIGYAVCTDIAGNVYACGYFRSSPITFDTITLTNATGAYDVFITKYDSSGNVLWARSTGGTGSDIAFSVAADASSNVYVAGYFGSPSIAFGVTTLTNYGATDMFLAKYNSAGIAQWAINSGGVTSEESHSVCTDQAGNVYVAGFFRSPAISFGLYNLTNASSNTADVFVASYDNAGNVRWATSAGGSADDYAWSVSANAFSDVYLAGYYASNSISFGSTTLTNASASFSWDIFLAKLATIVGINEPFGNNNRLIVYPNPASQGCGISIILAEPLFPNPEAEVCIFNVTGQKVYSEEINSHSIALECRLSPGIYFVKVRGYEQVWISKLSVE